MSGTPKKANCSQELNLKDIIGDCEPKIKFSIDEESGPNKRKARVQIRISGIEFNIEIHEDKDGNFTFRIPRGIYLAKDEEDFAVFIKSRPSEQNKEIKSKKDAFKNYICVNISEENQKKIIEAMKKIEKDLLVDKEKTALIKRILELQSSANQEKLKKKSVEELKKQIVRLEEDL